MANLVTTINSWLRKSERLQSALAAAMDLLDPGLTPVTVVNLLTWLNDATADGLEAFRQQYITLSAVQLFRLSTAGIPVTDITTQVSAGGTWALRTDAIDAVIVAVFADVRMAALVPVAVEQDLDLLLVEVMDRIDEIEVLTTFTSNQPIISNLETGMIIATGGLDTGTVGAGQVALFRAAVGATAAPAYGGNAASDALADLFDFVTVNKL